MTDTLFPLLDPPERALRTLPVLVDGGRHAVTCWWPDGSEPNLFRANGCICASYPFCDHIVHFAAEDQA